MAFKLEKPIMFSTEGFKRYSPDVKNKQNLIPSGDITMDGVDFPVHGVDNLGNEKIMKPGEKNISFPGDTVLETPVKNKTMAFKMKGMPGIAGVKAERDKIDKLSGKTQKVMKVKPKDEFSTVASRKRIRDKTVVAQGADQADLDSEKAYEESKKDAKLGGRWKGMTLGEFDANVKKERKSIGNDPKTLKAFNARQAKLRNQAINAD